MSHVLSQAVKSSGRGEWHLCRAQSFSHPKCCWLFPGVPPPLPSSRCLPWSLHLLLLPGSPPPKHGGKQQRTHHFPAFCPKLPSPDG